MTSPADSHKNRVGRRDHSNRLSRDSCDPPVPNRVRGGKSHCQTIVRADRTSSSALMLAQGSGVRDARSMQELTIIHYASPQHQGAYAGIVLPELGPTRSANASGSPGDFSCAKFRGRLGVTGLIELRIRVGSQFWQFVNHPVLRVLSSHAQCKGTNSCDIDRSRRPESVDRL